MTPYTVNIVVWLTIFLSGAVLVGRYLCHCLDSATDMEKAMTPRAVWIARLPLREGECYVLRSEERRVGKECRL